MHVLLQVDVHLEKKNTFYSKKTHSERERETANCMYCCRLTCTLPTGMASSRLSLPSHTVMTRSVCRFERRTGSTNALPFPFEGHEGLALLYTIPVTACAGGAGRGGGAGGRQVRPAGDAGGGRRTEHRRAARVRLVAEAGWRTQQTNACMQCVRELRPPQHPPCGTGKPRQTCAAYRTGLRAGLPRRRAPSRSI